MENVQGTKKQIDEEGVKKEKSSNIWIMIIITILLILFFGAAILGFYLLQNN